MATKKRGIDKWFKPIVSGLLAVVTVLGAVVAWRASLAGSESGDLDSSGIIAVQNQQAVRTKSFIENNEHLIAFTDYLRNRKLALGAGLDLINLPNLTQEQQLQLYRQFTEGMDLAATSKRFFFPGRYLNFNTTQGDTYDSTSEIQESYAAAERQVDLYPEKSFELSDELNAKVMGLLFMLVVLAVSLWMLALTDTLSSAVKYATALGGVIALILGAVGAYYVDSDIATPDEVQSFVLTALLISGAVVGLLIIGLLALTLARRKPPTTPATATATATAAVATGSWPPTPPPVPTDAANYPQPYPQTQPGDPSGYPQPYPQPYGQPQLQPQPQPQPQPPVQGMNYPPPPPQVYQPTAQPATAPPPANPAVATTPEVTKADDKEKGERFKEIITILIATVALLASIVAYLQSDAGNQESSANRNMQQFTLEAQGENTYGAAEMSFSFGTAAHAWKELDALAKSADKYEDPEGAKRYRAARDEITKLTSLLGPDRFDPAKEDVPNRSAYEADLYLVSATELTERSTVQLELKNAWGAKANTYVTLLTLLAVALALLGLSLTTSSFVRFIFAGVSVMLVAVVMVWVVGLYTQPIRVITDEAIAAYAKGYGAWWSGNSDDAIKAYDEALNIQPDYANALVERGNVYVSAGIDLQGAGQNDKANEKFDKAVADYLAAINTGRDDTNVNWNLAWVYYLKGKFDDAIKVNRHIMEIDPSAIGPRLNLALVLLVQGKFDDAELEYNTAIARVSDQVVAAMEAGKKLPKDFWYYLDAGVTDLDNLIDRIQGREYFYTQAPPRDMIANPDETVDVAVELIAKLKTNTAGFAGLGKPPSSTINTQVGNFVFTAKSHQNPKEYVEWDNNYFPYDTGTVKVGYYYKDLQPGQFVMFKVYLNTVEQLEYRYSFTWQGSTTEGDDFIDLADPATKFNFQSFADYSELYSLPSGDYIVEMYVDYHLVRRGFFQVEYKPADTGTPPEATPTP